MLPISPSGEHCHICFQWGKEMYSQTCRWRCYGSAPRPDPHPHPPNSPPLLNYLFQQLVCSLQLPEWGLLDSTLSAGATCSCNSSHYFGLYDGMVDWDSHHYSISLSIQAMKCVFFRNKTGLYLVIYLHQVTLCHCPFCRLDYHTIFPGCLMEHWTKQKILLGHALTHCTECPFVSNIMCPLFLVWYL